MPRVSAVLLALAVCLVTSVWCLPHEARARDDASCRAADQRIAKARLRMTLSLFRSRTSVFRIVSELARLGEIIEIPPSIGARMAEGSEKSPALALIDTEELSDFAIEMVRNHQNKTGDDKLVTDRSDGRAIKIADTAEPFAVSPDCIHNALRAESVAFRAEQAAQLAEVAADQAISLADHASGRAK